MKDELRTQLIEAGAIDVFGREVRTVKTEVSIRENGDGSATPESANLEGHAALFNKEANIGGWFREMIAPGAFTKTIKEADVRHLFNHDPSRILARTKSKTLKLDEDKTGLLYDAELNMDDPDAISVFHKVKRGDVDQSSFAFTVIRELWEEPDDPDTGELPLRTILEAKLFDTSTVTYPAYEDTTAFISSSVNAKVLQDLDLRSIDVFEIANENLTPDLAPALREAARRADELAVRCEEGSDCSRAAEKAPEQAEDRAAEEAPTEPIVDMTVEENADTIIRFLIAVQDPSELVQVDVVEELDIDDDVDDDIPLDQRRQMLINYQERQNQALLAQVNS